MTSSRLRPVLLLLTILGLPALAHAQLPGVGLPLFPPRLDKLDPLLVPAISQIAGRSPVIVRARDAASLGTVALLIQQSGGTLGQTLPIITAFAANVPNASLSVLSNSALVRRIALDRLVIGTLERAGATIGATVARQEFGLDGTGVGVAVIDSGVTSWHDDLADGPGSQRVDRFVDFVNGAVSPYDDYGHGTHVAGIIAGNGFDSGGARSGIAPGVRLVVLKVLDNTGAGRISNVIAALGYAVINREALNIRVINLSVGARVAESYDVDFVTQAAKRAVEAGIVVVAAAGNNGRVNGTTQYGGVTAPGNAPWVLTVGASSHQGTIDRSDDIVAAFSSRGPTAVDRSAKPDVVAPGVGIESLSDPASSMYTTRSTSLVAGTVPTSYLPYLSLSGTSQSTPVVSGTVALMLQANPALTPNAVKAILQFTSQIYPGYDALTQGAGFLNAYGAITLARYFADPSASPYPSAPEWSHQLIWGNHRVAGGLILPGVNAWSSEVVWGAAKQGTADVTWGTIWTPSLAGGSWRRWGTSCGGLLCQSVVWGSPDSENVVWGTTCGGSDCLALPGGIWSMSDEDAIVWGTSSEDDALVWGTTCTDTSCGY